MAIERTQNKLVNPGTISPFPLNCQQTPCLPLFFVLNLLTFQCTVCRKSIAECTFKFDQAELVMHNCRPGIDSLLTEMDAQFDCQCGHWRLAYFLPVSGWRQSGSFGSCRLPTNGPKVHRFRVSLAASGCSGGQHASFANLGRALLWHHSTATELARFEQMLFKYLIFAH